MTPNEAKRELTAFGELFEPVLRKAFLDALSDVVGSVQLNNLIEAIRAGDVDRAFRLLGLDDAALRPLTLAISQAFERGGVLTAATWPAKYLNYTTGRAVFRFNVRDSRAEAWLRDRSSLLVKSITDSARDNVREALTTGMVRGTNPRTTSLDIVGRVGASGRREGGVIGLTQNQTAWVNSARRKLETLDDGYFDMTLRDKRFDATVRKAIEAGEPLDPKTIDNLIVRYADRALKYRGDSIARTEAIQALNASDYEAHRQLVDQGGAPKSHIVGEWDSAGDTKVRPSHVYLDGQRQPIDTPFVGIDGDKMLFPGDTSLGARAKETVVCRCRRKSVIDWSFALKDLPR